MSTVPTLGYWHYRAMAAPIRYLLTYSGVEFIDKRYELEKVWNNGDELRKNWREKEQFSLGLDFPNVPYYIDGDIKLTHKVTILRHLARKYGLFASDEKSLARQDLIEQQLEDIIWDKFIDEVLFVDKDEFEKSKKEFLKVVLPQQLQLLSKFLGNNEWLNGKLSYVDFVAYEFFDWMRLFSPGSIDKFDNLNQYINRFENLPAIKAYRNSDKFKRNLIFGPNLNWGYNI